MIRAEALAVTGCVCLAIALVEAWCLTAVRNLESAALKRLFPDSQQLLRSHIDYLMMTGLLFGCYATFRQLGVVPPGALVAATCAGSLMNPAAFLASAMVPRLNKNPPPAAFAAIVTVGFVLTTGGYLGSAWLIARAALAVP